MAPHINVTSAPSTVSPFFVLHYHGDVMPPIKIASSCQHDHHRHHLFVQWHPFVSFIIILSIITVISNNIIIVIGNPIKPSLISVTFIIVATTILLGEIPHALMRLLVYNCPFGSASPDLDSMNLRLFHILPSPPLQWHWKPERQIGANRRKWTLGDSSKLSGCPCQATPTLLYPSSEWTKLYTTAKIAQNCTPME